MASNYGSVDYATAERIKEAAAACLKRVEALPKSQPLPLPDPIKVATALVLDTIRKHNFGHHECREDFLIYVESSLWNHRFYEATRDLNEVEQGQIRLAIRAHFDKEGPP